MISKNEFFDLIAARFKNKREAQKTIADLMHVSPDTVKKWMYNDVALSYERFCEMVHLFELEPEDIFRSQKRFVNFRYVELDEDSPENYLEYIRSLADMLEHVAGQADAKISFRADEIPIFHLLPFRNLSYFRLYCYGYEMFGYTMSFEEFVEQMQEYEVEQIFDRIKAAYDRVDSTEIWDDRVLNALLYHVEYMHDVKLFSNGSSALQLLDETEQLIVGFWRMAEAGKKETGAKFKFFKMAVPVRLGSMLVQYGDQTKLVIKLDTINSISTGNSAVTAEADRAFRAAIDKSAALGVGAKRERTLYFRKQKRRIESLKKRIRKGTRTS